jgi:hypothetical protein
VLQSNAEKKLKRRTFSLARLRNSDQFGNCEDGMTNERETKIAGVMPLREPRHRGHGCIMRNLEPP